MPVPTMLRVVEREAHVFLRLWRGSVFSGVVTPVLFLAAMGIGLGGVIDERDRAVDGLRYLEFVTPGLLAASAVLQGAAESLWPVMGGMKWMRQFHGMVATPIPPGDVYGGRLLWAGVRTAGGATLFLAVATAFGGVRSPTAVLAIPAAALAAVSLSAPLSAFAATQDTDLSFTLIMRVAVLPLFLFSGSFFPIEQLPSAVRPLALASPLWHGVELCRMATTGRVDASAVPLHLGVLLALTAVGWIWGRRTFSRRLAA